MQVKICVTFLDADGRLDCVNIEVDLANKVDRHLTPNQLGAVMPHIPNNQRVLNILVGRA